MYIDAIRLKPTSTPTPTPTPSNAAWVSIDTFNQDRCYSSSNIGGIVIQNGDCYNMKTIVCDGDKVIIFEYNDKQCTDRKIKPTTYPINQCGPTGAWGFSKIYRCLSAPPAYPEQSLVMSHYKGCGSGNTLSFYRWIPTYTCVAINRWALDPYTGSGAFEIPESDSASYSQRNSDDDYDSDTRSKLQMFSDHIDYLTGLSVEHKLNSAGKFKSSSGSGDSASGDGATGNTGSGGDSITGYTAFSTGSGGTGIYTSGSDPQINSVTFAIAECNQTRFAYSTYSVGYSASGTSGGPLPTGEYTSGDPYGSEMTALPGSGSGSGSGASGSGSTTTPPMGCSGRRNHHNDGNNNEKCYNDNTLFTLTCVPPYHSKRISKLAVLSFIIVEITLSISYIVSQVVESCGAIRLKPTSTPTPTPTQSWISIDTFNADRCYSSSSVGGIVIQNGDCYNMKTIVCDGDQVIVNEYNDEQCIDRHFKSTTYPTNQCGPTGTWGFSKIYRCLSAPPAYPEQSLVMSHYKGCGSGNTLSFYRWIPTYTCVAISKWALNPYTGTGDFEIPESDSASYSQRNSDDDYDSDTRSKLQMFSDHIDYLTGLSVEHKLNSAGKFKSSSGSGDSASGDGATGNTGSGGDSIITGNTAFSTGSGGTGIYTSGSEPQINSVTFAIAECNQTRFAYSTYSVGYSASGTSGGPLPTGEYTSGDPYGSEMTALPGSGSGSGLSGDSSQPMGCRDAYRQKL
ncbi:hypothetical protein PPL_05609 [Heterostelium album PN500]|uniref:Uncharacterized protein n=1 Tax=Heterostelium pallidum (strain ATCC 26659 / Pp 5 / PN500) TaxID=670386 RepID=D3BAN1_HETP5|nr:hypothetical protein PPL_05609 [Heterostelium album PN500]EFA81618.1 hypothetical protein PPL_05609 [Heterostelium album PN500]|eukprot:XP_020433735.1 hypothetical protein PPL_05609 [Heterostelium album PN500]